MESAVKKFHLQKWSSLKGFRSFYIRVQTQSTVSWFRTWRDCVSSFSPPHVGNYVFVPTPSLVAVFPSIACYGSWHLYTQCLGIIQFLPSLFVFFDFIPLLCQLLPQNCTKMAILEGLSPPCWGRHEGALGTRRLWERLVHHSSLRGRQRDMGRQRDR